MTIKRVTTQDISFLEEMLFEAFLWNPQSPRPDYEVFRKKPEFEKLLRNWGREGDVGFIAEIDGKAAGAIWRRLWTEEEQSYGYVNEQTPELGLAVKQTFRRRGVGRKLLQHMLDDARNEGIGAISLSVDPNNHARRLYESEGFEKIGESGTSWTLVLDLARHIIE